MYAWYEEHLGIARDPHAGGALFAWHETESGKEAKTVWSLFPQSSKYFDPSAAPVMINYRVADMEMLLSALQAKGIKILGHEDHEYGKFAWLMDPEGNKIELWEPPKK